MSKEDRKSSLEIYLENLGFTKCASGESTDGTEELIQRWYREGKYLKVDYYIKKKK